MSCSSSRVALLAIKEMVQEMITSSHHFNAFKGTCHYCDNVLLECAIKPLMNTCFNITANNFTILLNRWNTANKLTMKMVKDQKKMKRHVNLSKNNNDDEDTSAWTCEYCQSVLNSCGAVKQGNKSELHARCELLKNLLSYGLENLISLSKPELRSMAADLTLPFGTEISKDDLIKNVFDVMILKKVETAGQMLSVIENEEVC